MIDGLYDFFGLISLPGLDFILFSDWFGYGSDLENGVQPSRTRIIYNVENLER